MKSLASLLSPFVVRLREGDSIVARFLLFGVKECRRIVITLPDTASECSHIAASVRGFVAGDNFDFCL